MRPFLLCHQILLLAIPQCFLFVNADAAAVAPLVVISGGGPSGLLASILLNNIGVSSIVFERAKEPEEWSEKSYTIFLGDRGQSSLERGGCLQPARDAGIDGKFVFFFDGRTGGVKTIPRQPPGIGLTRPLLIGCLEKIALRCPRVTLKRGIGVSEVSNDEERGLRVGLDDGTFIPATHVVGADGKWSQVRQSIPSLNSQAKMVTSPSFGVHMNSPRSPEGFRQDGTYVINPRKECLFYVIAAPRASGGYSITMVCYDETVERYPWLVPPEDMKLDEQSKGRWEESRRDGALSDHMETLFRDELPSFHEALEKDTFKSCRVNRRATWLQMFDDDANSGPYSTDDGLVVLIGDAAHAMTASMGEGCNTALESAVRLVDSVSSVMTDKGETECSLETLSEGFLQFGSSRPKEVIPIQEASAARSILRKT
ncbi:hypothetical protein ACHAWF_011501 [Thalassiosira exigua]